MADTVLNLAKFTLGDREFYSRWQGIGPVTATISEDKEDVLVLVVDQHTKVDAEYLRKFPNLKYVCSATTGHTHLNFDPEACSVTLVTLRDERNFLQSIWSVSQFTMMLILMLARHNKSPGVLLRGKTLAIIGFGRIGKHLECLAKPFGMRIYTYDIDSKEGGLANLFSFADFISIHLPESKDTVGMIDEKLITSMRKSSCLVNTARPSIVDNVALFKALAEKKIAGAAIDGTGIHYPTLPNLIVTPHIAGVTLEDRIATDKFIIQKLSDQIAKDTYSKRRVVET